MLKDREGRSLRPGERIIMQNTGSLVDGTRLHVATGSNSRGRPDLREVIAGMKRLHQHVPHMPLAEIADAYVPVTTRSVQGGRRSQPYLIPRHMVVKNVARENNAARSIQRRVRANNLVGAHNLAIAQATSALPINVRHAIGDEVARDRRRSGRNPTGRAQPARSAYEDARSVQMMGILSGKRDRPAGDVPWLDPAVSYALPENARRIISSHMHASREPVPPRSSTVGLASMGYQRRAKRHRARKSAKPVKRSRKRLRIIDIMRV